MDETTKLILTTSVPILLAIFGYLATYLYNLKLAQRGLALPSWNGLPCLLD